MYAMEALLAIQTIEGQSEKKCVIYAEHCRLIVLHCQQQQQRFIPISQEILSSRR